MKTKAKIVEHIIKILRVISEASNNFPLSYSSVSPFLADWKIRYSLKILITRKILNILTNARVLEPLELSNMLIRTGRIVMRSRMLRTATMNFFLSLA